MSSFRVLLFVFQCGALAACGNNKGSPFLETEGGADDASSDSTNPMLEDSSPIDSPPGDGKPMAINLIPNGNFEQGNVLFGSDYTYAVNNTVEGEYTVGTNGQAFNGALVTAGDHTSGMSKMFIGNGKSTPDRVWFTQSNINVQPNTQYYFEAFVMNLCCAMGLGNGIDPVGPSVLSFYANGQLLATRTSMKLGKWEGMTTMWNSGASSTVTLKLVNANTDALGNDFAVDDIYLGTISTVNPPN